MRLQLPLPWRTRHNSASGLQAETYSLGCAHLPAHNLAEDALKRAFFRYRVKLVSHWGLLSSWSSFDSWCLVPIWSSSFCTLPQFSDVRSTPVLHDPIDHLQPLSLGRFGSLGISSPSREVGREEFQERGEISLAGLPSDRVLLLAWLAPADVLRRSLAGCP